jgi:hypothetical protein
MSNAGRYYGLFGSSGHHRRYLQTLSRKEWELFRGYGGTPRGLAHRWHRKAFMAYAVEVRYSKGALGRVYVVAWFPMVLPIRGAGNPPGAFRPYPH